MTDGLTDALHSVDVERVSIELDVEDDPSTDPVVDPLPPPSARPRLTAVGRQRLQERFAMALELDPPGERKLTAAQKTAYTRWLDFYLAL